MVIIWNTMLQACSESMLKEQVNRQTKAVATIMKQRLRLFGHIMYFPDVPFPHKQRITAYPHLVTGPCLPVIGCFNWPLFSLSPRRHFYQMYTHHTLALTGYSHPHRLQRLRARCGVCLRTGCPANCTDICC